MYCSQCGKEIDDNSKFCPECGENISDDSSSSIPKHKVLSWERKKNFTIFSIKGAVIVFVVLVVVALGAVLYFSESPLTNCQELSDAMVGNKTENLGREGNILKSELKEVLSEEPNNLVCVVDVVATIGDYELILEYDGEILKWEGYINPTNCLELSDAMLGQEVQNHFGRKGEILKSELKEVISEEPNNLVCVVDVVTTIGDYEVMSEYDGEFLRWDSNE